MTSTRALVILSLAASTPFLDVEARGGFKLPVPDYRIRFRLDEVVSSTSEAATRAGWFLSGGPKRLDLTPGEWSDWIEIQGEFKSRLATKTYPNLYARNWPFVVAFTIHPQPVDRVRLTVEWQVGEQKGSYVATYGGVSVATLLWKDDSGAVHVGPASEFNQRYVSQVEKLELTPENLPKQFVFVDRFIGIDSEEKSWNEGLHLLKLLGFNTIADASKTRVAREGITRTAGAVYWPPLIHDADTNVTSRAAMNEWAQKIAEGYRKAGWNPDDVAYFALADEPGWYYPAAFNGTWPKNEPAMRARMLALFRDYLRAKGFKPGQFGAKTWDEVEFLGRSGAKDLAAKRRYFWTMRFFADNSADVFARWTQAIERAFHPGIPVSCNWNFFAGRYYVPGPVANNADKQSPDAAMGGHDWIDFGRRRGVTCLWTEDWFKDAMASQWSFYMSKLRSGADHYNSRRKPDDPPPIGTGGYVIGATTGDLPGGTLQKILSVLGHGGKVIKFYVFGPEYAFPGNCWSENPTRFAEIARAMRVVGKAEDLLFPGKPIPAQVAILAPQSAQVWDKKDEEIASGISDATNVNLNRATVDYMAEVFNLYTALQHANVPADWVDEQDLEERTYLTRFKVLYVTTPNLSARAAEALRAWVSSGGSLVLIAGAGQSDEYDEPSRAMENVAGIKPIRRERIYSPAHASAKGEIAAVDGAASTRFVGHGFAQVLEPVSATAIGRFVERGKAAVTERRLGKGTVTVFGTLVGTAYNLGGQSDAARDWATRPVRGAGVRVPVTTSLPRIETPVLASDAGLAVTVLNWSGQPQQNVSFEIQSMRPVNRVESVSAGRLAFSSRDGVVEVSLRELAAADVIKLYW